MSHTDTTDTITWKRDGRGRQISTCGQWAVQVDGWQRVGNDTYGERGTEWAAVHAPTDQNIDWYPTMREAKAACEREARRSA